jgi:hypothetical protein
MQFLNNYFYKISESKVFLITLFFLNVLILIMRRPDSIFSSQPWAEDGFLYIQSAIYHPWINIIFPYGDYFFLIPRIIANFTIPLTIIHAPLIMNLSTFVIISFCSVYFSTTNFRFILKNDTLRVLCSLFVVLIPASSVASVEDYTLENMGWFLTFFAVLFLTYLLFRYEEYTLKSKLKKSLYVVFSSLIFLTAPATFVLLPILIYVIFREFKKEQRLKNVLPFILLSIVLIFHIFIFYYVYVYVDDLHPSNQDFPINIIAKSFANIFTVNVARTFYHDTNTLATTLGNFIYLIPIGFIIMILINPKNNISKIDLFLLLFTSLELFLTMIFRSGFLLQYMILPTTVINDRYFIIPTIIIFILLIRQLQERKSWIFKLVLIVIISIIAYNIVTGFSIVSLVDFNYQNIAKMYMVGSNDFCLIPINPSSNYRDLLIPCSDPEPEWKELKQISGSGKLVIQHVIDNNYDNNFQIQINQDLETVYTPLQEYSPLFSKYENRPPVLQGGLENESIDAEVYLKFSNQGDIIVIHTSKMIGHDPFDLSKFSNIYFKWRAALNPKDFKNTCYDLNALIFLKNQGTYYEIPEQKQICIKFIK